jgi:cytochrome c oxidase subunit 1
VLGEDGMTRRIADYPADAGWSGLNLLSSIGAYLVGASILVFIVNALVSRRLASDDPWGGHTLEWATLSPPPRENFTTVPTVRSYAPLLDA